MNPVDLELIKINRQWRRELATHLDFKMFIAEGEKHEVQLFDGLMKTKMTDEGDDDDIYLIHYQDFISKNTFGQSLFDDWAEYYKLWQEKEDNIPVWEVENNAKAETDAYKAIQPLIDLKKNFKGLKDVVLFIYVAPIKIENFAEFETWLNHWCLLCNQQNINDIKIIWSQHHTHKLIKKNQWAHNFRVNVDIHQLMKNTAANTNKKKNSPDTDFQQQILTASNHLSKNRFDEAEIALKSAVKLAKDIKNKEGEITSYFFLTQVYNAKGRNTDVKVTFEKIFSIVEPNSPLKIQMYMNYGGYLLGRSKKDKAEEVFNKAAEISKSIGNHAMAMECYRIIGAFNDTLLTKGKVIQYYEKAVELSNHIPPENIEQSSIQAIASMLMKKYDSNSQEAINLHQKMKVHFGDHWQIAVEQPKNTIG